MTAPCRIDHQGTLRKARKGLGIQQPAGRGGQRKKADQNIALFEKGWKGSLSCDCLDTLDRLQAPAPARDIVANGSDMSGSRLAHDAKPHDADADLARIRMKMPGPDPLDLLLVISSEPAVVTQHHRQDIFRHAGCHHRIGQANDWNIRQLAGVTPKLVHTRPRHDNGLEPIHGGKEVWFRSPDHGNFNRAGITDIRPLMQVMMLGLPFHFSQPILGILPGKINQDLHALPLSAVLNGRRHV